MKLLSFILIILSTSVCLSEANEVQQSVLGFVQGYICDNVDAFKLSYSENPEMWAACGLEAQKSALPEAIGSSVASSHHGHHPVVQTHAIEWYRNWATCSVCGVASQTFYKLATDPLYIKALQGYAWFLCSTQFSQSFCKYYVAEQVVRLDVEIFPIMLSTNFFCGYLLDLCETNYYSTLTTRQYELDNVGMANKPSNTLDNSFLDNLYSQPGLSADFKVLWISDLDIDLNYVYESSTVCEDTSCCHAKDIPTNELDLAPLYGHTNCNLPIDGFYKMIDTLNALNNSVDFSFNSVVYGGSGSAVNPEQLSRTQVMNVHQNVLKYIRQKNDYVGIYHSLGPKDFFPTDYQLFSSTAQPRPAEVWPYATSASQQTTNQGTTWTAEKAAADLLLTDMNIAIHPNIGGTAGDANTAFPSQYSSIASSQTAINAFKANGYYTIRPVVFMQGYDGGSPQKAITAFPKNDLNVISLNTNACHNRNFALMRERDDPGNQLAWLITTLTQFETDGEKAWIIGNVNPGSKYCNSRWSRRYNSIVNRFQHVIRSQLFGHEDEEYFSLQYPNNAGESQNPYGTTFQGAKATSLGQNPQFKIIKMDYSNYMPKEIITYEFDLIAVNQNPDAEPSTLLKKIRSMPADLDGASTLRPFDLVAFISRLNITEKIAVDFNNKFCPTQKQDDSNQCRIKECGTICRHNMACKLGNASSVDIMACRKVGLQDTDYGLEYMISLLQNPWVNFCTAEGATGSYAGADCNKHAEDTYTYWSH